MTDIRFYHMERSDLLQTLPALAGKALEKGHRIVVKTANEAMRDKLNDHLWTYKPESFLPHGNEKDGNAQDQPLWLTTSNENPNGADVLILTQNTENEHFKDFSLVCEIFDGQDEQSVSKARARWKNYKDDEKLNLTYWQQNPKGGWDKKG